MRKSINILGIRGIPASHGGFETFAEKLALYLVERDWKVTVYCQETGKGPIYNSEWNGVNLIHIPSGNDGSLATAVFDFKSTLHAAKNKGLALVLGYNTAIFSIVYRLKGINNLINMDGIEWKREKWSFPMRAWFYFNELAGCYLGNHLIADHPEIGKHLAKKVKQEKITVIAYGSDYIDNADNTVLEQYGLESNKYAIVIARPEPENSIKEIVTAFSLKPQGIKLVVLGNYNDTVDYQKETLAAASDEVCFLGAIYDQSIVKALRYHALFYIHGHRVGGTNPSLVEALGAGNPILAHDNKYNRWVAGSDQYYFSDQDGCAKQIEKMISHGMLEENKRQSLSRHQSMFTWDKILGEYTQLFDHWYKD